MKAKQKQELTDWLMDREEAARLMGVSPSTIERLREDGAIPFYDLALPKAKKPIVRYRKSELEAYINQRRVA